MGRSRFYLQRGSALQTLFSSLPLSRIPLIRIDKVIDKIHNAIFYTNLVTATVFLPYFGVAGILHGLEITTETALFPSYLSSAFIFNLSYKDMFLRGFYAVVIALYTVSGRCKSDARV